MIVSNSLSTLKDVAQLIRLFLYLHPITGTPSKKGFSMFMDFLRRRLTVESEEDLRQLGPQPNQALDIPVLTNRPMRRFADISSLLMSSVVIIVCV